MFEKPRTGLWGEGWYSAACLDRYYDLQLVIFAANLLLFSLVSFSGFSSQWTITLSYNGTNTLDLSVGNPIGCTVSSLTPECTDGPAVVRHERTSANVVTVTSPYTVSQKSISNSYFSYQLSLIYPRPNFFHSHFHHLYRFWSLWWSSFAYTRRMCLSSTQSGAARWCWWTFTRLQ